MVIEHELVSVVVVTYNSSKFIIETLESLCSQTYPNIELIISDDCSTDDTILVCENWIKEFGSELTNVELITVNNNTGISQNLNRGVEKSKGVWIKPLAGDDILTQNCIESNINFVQNTDIDFVGSDRFIFDENVSNYKLESNKLPLIGYPQITASMQYEAALRGFGFPQCTWFYRKSAIMKIGLYDEKYPMMEDWPIKLKVLRCGNKIHYNPKPTILYRIHGNSISHANQKFYSKWNINTFLQVKRDLMMPYLPNDEKFVMLYDLFIIKCIFNSNLNNINYLNRIIIKTLMLPIRTMNLFFKFRLKRCIKRELNA